MSNVISIFKNKPAKAKTVLPPGNPYRKIPAVKTQDSQKQIQKPASLSPSSSPSSSPSRSPSGPSSAPTSTGAALPQANTQALTQLKTSYNNLVQLQSRLRFMLEELENTVIRK